MRFLGLVFAFAALCARAGAQSVHLVTDEPSWVSAISSAVAGDVLQIPVPEFTLTIQPVVERGITIESTAPGGTIVLCDSNFIVRNLPAGESAIVRRLELRRVQSSPTVIQSRSFELTDCAGVVSLESCTVPTDSNAFVSGIDHFAHPLAGANVTNCAAVLLVDCTLVGRRGSWPPNALFGADPAFPGLDVVHSHVYAQDCVLQGGGLSDGNLSGGFTLAPSYLPGPGARINGGSLHAAGTSFIAGWAADGQVIQPSGFCVSGSGGGHAVVAVAMPALAELNDCIRIPSAMGTNCPSPAISGSPAVGFDVAGTQLLVNSQPLRFRIVPSSFSAGTTVKFDLSAPGLSLVLIAFSTAVAPPLPLPVFGAWIQTAPLLLLYQGMPFPGNLSVFVQAPAMPIGAPPVGLWAQAASIDFTTPIPTLTALPPASATAF